MSNQPDLSVTLAGINLKTPVLFASGCAGYGEELGEMMDLSRAGGIIVKSLSLAPRSGNPPVRIVETAAGMLNSIGLQNVGVDAFIASKLQALRKAGIPIIANVAGSTIEEYDEVCRKLASAGGVAAIELNISCPNVKKGGMQFGVDPAMVREVVGRAKASCPGPLIVKLSPNVTDITVIAQAAVDGGADALSVANTFLGMAIDPYSAKPRLSTGFGGLSGPAIKPLALRCVWQVAAKVKVPIIGLGGIMTGEDAAEFMLAGATAVAVGTASFLDPGAVPRITDELSAYLVRRGLGAVRDLTGAAQRS
jgi:dihydroorotate dehydrogenase (NAD+) catalytic subunit